MTGADIFSSECLRFWVIQQEEPCWLGEVVLEGVRTAGGRAPATRIRQDVPGSAVVSGFTPAAAQSLSLLPSPLRQRPRAVSILLPP